MKKKGLALAVIFIFALGMVSIPGKAAAADKVRLSFATTSFAIWFNKMTIGVSKRKGGLGFYEDEGLDVLITGAPGSSAVVKLAGAGQIDVTGPAGYVTLITGVDKGLPITTPWIETRQNIFFVVVPESSKYMTMRDLKGKTIGVYSMGSDGVPMAKAMAQDAGLNPKTDISVAPIGLGAQAVNAIKSGQVVGGSYWDTGIAMMEVLGLKFRYITTPGVSKAAYSSGFLANTNFLKNKRSVAVRFFRAIAKSDVFLQTNPEASVKIHWKLYPISKPKTGDPAKNLRGQTHIVKARIRNVKKLKDKSIKFGWMDKKIWQDTVDFYHKMGMIKSKVPVGKIFTNDLIDEGNNFDHDKVIQMAKDWKE